MEAQKAHQVDTERLQKRENINFEEVNAILKASSSYQKPSSTNVVLPVLMEVPKSVQGPPQELLGDPSRGSGAALGLPWGALGGPSGERWGPLETLANRRACKIIGFTV